MSGKQPNYHSSLGDFQAAIVAAFGGVQAFARHLFECYGAESATAATKVRIMDLIVRIFAQNEKSGRQDNELEGFTEKDLDEEINRLRKQIEEDDATP